MTECNDYKKKITQACIQICFLIPQNVFKLQQNKHCDKAAYIMKYNHKLSFNKAQLPCYPSATQYLQKVPNVDLLYQNFTKYFTF